MATKLLTILIVAAVLVGSAAASLRVNRTFPAVGTDFCRPRLEGGGCLERVAGFSGGPQ